LAVFALVAVAMLAGGCEYLQGLAPGLGPIDPNAPGFSFDPNEPIPSFDPNAPVPSFDPNAPVPSFDPNEPPPTFEPGVPSFDPEASYVPKATFKHGSATLTIGSKVIKLDRLVGNAFLSDEFGGQASWTNGSGWYAQAFGIGDANSEFGADAFVSFDRIEGGRHWIVGDPSLCEITVTRADETGLAGTAVCQGLRWADLMAAYANPSGPVYVEGEPPFDAKLTFEATP
jgi:hypothetical protein